MLPDQRFLTAEQYLLTTLVVKIAIMAIFATMLVRYHRFRALFISERRAWPARAFFAFGFGLPLAAGVAARVLLRYNAADLTLEGAFLAGLIAGPWAGALVGLLVGLPPLAAGEFAALPFAVGCGFVAGGIREACPKEDIWRFSPMGLLDLPRYVWRAFRNLRVDWQVVMMAAIIGLEILRQALGHRWPARMFVIPPTSILTTAAEWLAAVLCVATPIKIWNTARIEHRLMEQDKLLLQSRIDGLSRQINPHFLFNTLASISSLIRTKPETARMLILKLSNLLRRLLRSQEHFVPLREELASVDEYLDIEVVRFGSQLEVVKDVQPAALDVLVPSMLLQPLIENSIKHGLAPRIGGGRIILRARVQDGHAVIEIDDNGLGMTEERLSRALTDGIGLSNVHERLRVMYGANASLRLTSRKDAGTVARIDVPLVPPPEPEAV